MDLASAIAYFIGIILLLLIIQLLAKPLEWALKLLGNAVLGGLILWGLNWAGEFVDWHLGLNPASAAVVGILGVPGLASLVLLRLLFP